MTGRRTSARRSGRPSQEALSGTKNSAVVIDITAAHTLALLDPELRSQLLSGFGHVRASDDAYHGTTFWCDDHHLRSVAADMSVPTFGTVDLIRHLHSRGQIPRELRAAAEAVLLTNYFTDLGFDRNTFDLAAAIDCRAPRGVAFALTRPATWADPEAVIEFVLAMLRQAATVGPEQIEDWVSATAIGLVRITEDDSGAGANLQALLN